MPYVVALDPSFRNTGYAVIELGPDGPVVRDVGVIVTKKGKDGYVCEDNHRCSQEIANGLRTVLHAWKPVVVYAEAESGSQSSKAAQLMGKSWGVVSAVTLMVDVPVMQVQPKELKKALTGEQTASKKDIEAAVKERFPGVEKLFEDIKPRGVHEHGYDAIAVFISREEEINFNYA